MFETVKCKRALSPSGLPGIDYALNPYGGCEHGCVYCYGPEVTHTEFGQWRIVKVRSNIAERLAKEVRNIDGTVGVGTVTDPYQYAEKRFMLTSQCLEVLRSAGLRITITTLDEKASHVTEPGAPLPARRLDALRELTCAGVDTYALVGPVLRFLEGREEEFVEAVASTGVRRMCIDRLNLRPLLSQRLDRMGITGSAEALEKIRRLAGDSGMEVTDVF